MPTTGVTVDGGIHVRSNGLDDVATLRARTELHKTINLREFISNQVTDENTQRDDAYISRFAFIAPNAQRTTTEKHKQ